jgi:predicted flap endonuclease-1-like 5' DNA nuclease
MADHRTGMTGNTMLAVAAGVGALVLLALWLAAGYGFIGALLIGLLVGGVVYAILFYGFGNMHPGATEDGAAPHVAAPGHTGSGAGAVSGATASERAPEAPGPTGAGASAAATGMLPPDEPSQTVPDTGAMHERYEETAAPDPAETTNPAPEAETGPAPTPTPAPAPAPETTPEPASQPTPEPPAEDREETRPAADPAPAAARPAPAASAEEPAPAAPSVAAPVTDGEGTPPPQMPAPRPGGGDDLQQIKGVGPKLAVTLNEMGIWHYDQIAAWGPEEIAYMDANLKGFRGRVSRDDWAGQARALAEGK